MAQKRKLNRGLEARLGTGLLAKGQDEIQGQVDRQGEVDRQGKVGQRQVAIGVGTFTGRETSS